MGALWSRQVGSIRGRVMGLLAFACLLILVIIIPNEIWAGLLYLGLVLVLCYVGFWALVLWLSGI